MRILVIDDDVKARVAAAIEAARQNPLDYTDPGFIERNAFVNPEDKVHKLTDRPEDFDARPPSQHVDIDLGYRVAVSFEKQPAGIVKHISISVDDPGAVPNEHAIKMIMRLFGIPAPHEIWLEEFDRDHFAVNILHLEEPAVENTC